MAHFKNFELEVIEYTCWLNTFQWWKKESQDIEERRLNVYSLFTFTSALSIE